MTDLSVPGGMLGALWPDTRHLLADEAVAALAGYADGNDQRGRLDDACLGLLRDAGYFGLPVPRELEGGGATIVECCAVQRRIGAADPALAVAVNMHLFSVGVMVEHWLSARDQSWLLLEAIATQGRIVASAFAEPGLGGSLLRSNGTARRDGKDWILNGRKMPCSLAERSDLLCLQVQDVQPGPESLLVALVPTDSPGVTVTRTWNTLGMRASESDSVVLTDCRIPDDLVFHRSAPGASTDPVFAASLGWFCVTASATYLGLVDAMMSEARRALDHSRLDHLGASRAQLPSYQTQLGEVVGAALPLEASCLRLAEALDQRSVDPWQLLPSLLALKHAVADLALRAADAVPELVGVASYGATGRAARLWRDAQAAHYHPPTRTTTRQLLGRWALGLPLNFELRERPSDDPADLG